MRRCTLLIKKIGKIITAAMLAVSVTISSVPMYAAADSPSFEVLLSTGKAYYYKNGVKQYYDNTGIQIGFKPAGGMKTVEDALTYYTIVKEVLGEKWLTNKLFRLGTSSLANKLLSDIKGEEIKFF